MADQRVNKWVQRGCIYLWRHAGNPRNYCGWHMTADDAGCRSLLDLLDIIRDAQYAAKRTIQLTRPSEHELTSGCSAPPRPATRWELSHSKPSMAPAHWCLSVEGTRVMLELGAERLEELWEGIQGIPNGSGDYCIGDDGQELWFWWRTG